MAFARAGAAAGAVRGRPALGSPERGPRRNRGRLNLDPEVKAQIEHLKEAGATREEIRAALAAQGVELPERGPRGNRGRLNLDPEVKAQIEQLKADGATREEVRTALAAQGVELPERVPRGNREGGRRGGGRRSGR